MAWRRVFYVIDHQRPDRTHWSKPEISSTSVLAAGDDAAAELGKRFELARSWSAREGRMVRVRVWPEPADQDGRLSFDPDDQSAEGTWTYTSVEVTR